MNISKIDLKINKSWEGIIKNYSTVGFLSENYLEKAKNWYILGYYQAIKEILSNGLPGG